MDTKYLTRTIKKEKLTSSHLEETKDIHVYLPPEYDDSLLYPLLILHDGPDYLNLGRIATQANQLLSKNEMVPVVMAFVPVDKTKRTAQYSPTGAFHEAHELMIVEELLPLMQQRYAVDTSTDKLVIGGSSLGGTASLHIALEYPEICNRVLSQSGAFLEQTVHDLSRVYSLQFLEIYQSIGLSETAIETHMGTLDLVARNREVHQLLLEKRAHVAYHEEAGDHTWGFWQRELPRALKFFFSTN
ncbi:esterase family protein [Thermoactinomyces sp. DSM 45892]|uniref:alpha/beta hydrolase n=1 Tax=Thermoactinomyces sp. DSM 45892 TaxID=1882753 RepID=UPI000898AD94|nr:alpha/beta hydrolase-fold protein [Thermoactinomyces sp. DSM 45892]SDZ36700.1 Enterochelin esterase [Thermoactinomyces sp. DSM 45892]